MRTWIGAAVAIAAIIVSATVALHVAAKQREQMRQIELHRRDPSVPLTPPPSRAARFLQRLGLDIALFILNLVFLVQNLLTRHPVTPVLVFVIDVQTLALFGLAGIIRVKWVLDRANRDLDAAYREL